MKFPSPSALAVCLSVLAVSPGMAADSPVLEFRLNSNELPMQSSGTSSGYLEEISGSSFQSAGGQGTSGKPEDRAFDNSGASRMGGTEPAPGQGKGLLVSMSELPRALQSFTVQGWFKTTGENPGNYARLLDSPRMGIFFAPEGLHFSLFSGASGKSSAVCDEDLFFQEGKWVFWAISYDGIDTVDQVRFYYGSEDEPVREVGVFTVSGGAVRHSGNGQLVWGNTESGERPFRGLLDNLRFWGSTDGANGALKLDDLEAIRRGDLDLQKP